MSPSIQFTRRKFLTNLLMLSGGLAALSKTLFANAALAQEINTSDPQFLERKKRWENLSPEQKEKARAAYVKFKSLPPERQVQVRENFRRWQSLPPERRSQIRARFSKWRKLSPARRNVIRKRFQRERFQKRNRSR
jgi:hypothetical protein